MSDSGYFIVEARWESGNRPEFFEVDLACGSFSEAKEAAKNYVHLKEPLIWIEGDSDEQGPVWYASTPSITFRIRS